jgi:hypothetical protein
MACKGSGVQIPSAPPHFTRSNGVKLSNQAGTEPQQNPNPVATPPPGRLNVMPTVVDSEPTYPYRRGGTRQLPRSTARGPIDRRYGLPCSWRLGRPCTRHRRDRVGRPAPLRTLVAGGRAHPATMPGRHGRSLAASRLAGLRTQGIPRRACHQAVHCWPLGFPHGPRHAKGAGAIDLLPAPSRLLASLSTAT